MKKLISIIALFLFSSFQLFAQHDLVGTWERKNDTINSVKIITPTHWMVYAEEKNQNGTEFMWSHGGTYTLKGNNYVENIETASWEDYGEVKTDFTIKIEGNTLYHKGSLIMEDGSVVPIDEVWKRANTNNSYNNNPSVGVWDQLNSTYTLPDGSEESHTNDTATRFQIITPTHWMRMSHRDDKFEHFMGGTYKFDGKKMYPNFEFSSFPDDEYSEVVIDQRVNGDKMYWDGYAISKKDNKKLTFKDEFQLVGPKVSK
ncbi:MAG TPA: hypothetical protein VK921_16900 [Anditalea sp.]|nr:hypothetical protein [Anditalea sp.]